nr:transposase (putative), gypsy type [Tanacetum cinerariifolium]
MGIKTYVFHDFLERVGILSGNDLFVIVVADTDCLLRMCCRSALSVYVLKHLGRSQLISGLSGSSIMDINYVLTQKAFDIFCQKFHIPEDVYPQLPSPNHTIHEMPVGKIDPFPKSTKFSVDDYGTFVAHLASFWKFLKPFLCLIGMSRNYTLDEDTYPAFLRDDEMEMDLFSFIQVADPTKVKVGERERAEEEAKLLDSTVRRVVSLLPVAPARYENELKESVERFFDEGGSADQVDSAADGGQEKRQVVIDASGSSHPPKKLKGTTELLVRQPFVHESGALADSITRHNIRTFGASERPAFVPLVITEAVVTSHVVNVHSVPEMGVKVTSPVCAFLFQDSDSTEIVKADALGPSYSAKQDLSMGSRELNSETLHQILEMDYHHLFTEFNVGTARQACLNAEVRMRAEDAEIKSLKPQLLLKKTEAAEAIHLHAQVFASEAAEKLHDLELKELNAAMSSLQSQNDGLVDQVHALEATCFGFRERLSGYKNLTDRLEEFQDAQLKAVNDKVAKLDADLAEMACHLEEKFYPHLLTTIFGRRWLLTYGLKLVLIKCLNSSEYLTALGATISRAIEKWMQDGLATGIDHGREGRSLTDVASYNHSAEVDFNCAVQELCEINFLLLAELKSYKDASVEDIMNLLHLEGPLADAPDQGKHCSGTHRVVPKSWIYYLRYANSSAVATQQLSSGNSSALTVAKCSSSGIFTASSGNALEHFIPNIPGL